jgi:hypothetical protein
MEFYAFKGDIKSFFPLQIIRFKAVIKRTIADHRVIDLVNTILDAGVLWASIGALTSQLLANYALDWLDHYVKEILKSSFILDIWMICCLDQDCAGGKRNQWALGKLIESVLGLTMNPKSKVIRVNVEYPFCVLEYGLPIRHR